MGQVIGLLGVCLVLGVLARRSGRFPEATASVFNVFLLNVSLPALVLRAMHRLEFVPGLVVAAVAPWLLFVGSSVFMRLLGPRLGLSRESVAALVLTAGLGNTAFVGLPMAAALLGPDGMAVAVVVDQLGSFLVVATLATLTAAKAHAQASLSVRMLVRKVLVFPPFQALVLALVLRPFAFPDWMDSVLQRLGDLLTPLALFLVGFQLRLGGLRARVPALALGLSYKLVLAPLVALAVVAFMPGLALVVKQTTVLQIAMAPMVTAALLAAEYELDPELAVLMVGVGIPLSFLTAPLFMAQVH
ncbi:AEC family transporter [Corallococcus praedator]|uniref:AEC family transporter n=1 Tax=Corallococcus praedator TaxID=2316724 RepID=A0ABX9Q7V9_9BACT|nr:MULTISPECIES: AEC family transporter [Corallococcus]RKH02282.1 AEC family transporter [Corallococcus sp. CA047B]RKH22635.1 AEC family transporter [Corallococcus sp. CA031C]RKH92783.1 AEC family transporter [Corallococcus praedator]